VAPALLISMHEETGLPLPLPLPLSLRQLRALMGDYREHTGASSKHPAVPQLQYFNGIRAFQALQSQINGTGSLEA
jgi:hypothetical protein